MWGYNCYDILLADMRKIKPKLLTVHKKSFIKVHGLFLQQFALTTNYLQSQCNKSSLLS